MRYIASLILFMLAISGARSQGVCEGNLGENIFEEGDFGSGAPFIVLSDPGIAPGFIYSTTMPIRDGEYVLTNDMAKWSNIYGSWLQIRDNSSDPQGYMMVVNASYTPGIFYEQTIDGLCDNTLYSFSADIINVIRATTLNHILPDVSFLIDDEVRFSTGPIPQNERWGTYGFTFVTGVGQESVKLTLRNNAPGGLGNDLALDNISFRACGPPAFIDITGSDEVCENAALYPELIANVESDEGYYQWQISGDNGVTWTDLSGATNKAYRSDQLPAGSYQFRYYFGSSPAHIENPKCRIVSAIRYLEVLPIHFTIIDTLCEGLAFDLGGVLYDETGTYYGELVAANGCDSIVTLDLTIVPAADINASLGSASPLCVGYNDGQISISNISGGTSPYTTTLVGLPGEGAGEMFSVPAGNYVVSVEDRYKCRALFDIDVIDPPEFIVTANATDPDILIGHSTQLEAVGSQPIQSVEWSPGIGVSCQTCPTTLATPFESIIYVVTAATEVGCVDTDSILVVVDRDPEVFVPNVFSPNADRVNDTWGFYADPLSIPMISELYVVDRWGNVVYGISGVSSVHSGELWDGNYNSRPVPNGVYTYVLKLKLADLSIVTKHGSVTIVR